MVGSLGLKWAFQLDILLIYLMRAEWSIRNFGMGETLLKRDEQGESLSGQAYLMLEREIVTLRLAPGQMLTEGALIERLGVGRTPVREAIQRLAWEGLVEVRPRSGVRVADLDPMDFAKILEVRRGVEEVLARSAARYASSADDEAFDFVGDQMREAAAQGNVDLFLDADKAFDTVLAGAAANPYAARLAAPLQTHSRRFWFRLQRPDSLPNAVERHLALIVAIMARDEGRAVEAADQLIDHLKR
jgi:DNA-binding GntR family transcriptional regulator